jgi:DNA-binding beta-propeller fold protein YncE
VPLTTLLSFALLPALLTAPLAPSIALPGGPPVGMDYLAYDRGTARVWVPAGNTGNVDVVDTATGQVTPVGGFATRPSPRPGRPKMGPSSAAIADGTAWIGNRGDNRLCPFDARTLTKGDCVQLATMPDGLAYVAGTRELWVTTPRDQTITIVALAGKKPAVPQTIKLDGAPEGLAVDGARGVFYTNLEDKDQTLAIDVKTRRVVARYAPGCGADGPRGLAWSGVDRLLFVACTHGAVVLDVAHDGKPVGRLETGGGVDNLDYCAARRLLYVASGSDGKLTLAHVAAGGGLKVVATVATAKGARTAVVDAKGTAYLPDSMGGRLLVVRPPAAETPSAP